LYSWWWVRLSPETCRVKPLRIKKRNWLLFSCLRKGVKSDYWLHLLSVCLSAVLVEKLGFQRKDFQKNWISEFFFNSVMKTEVLSKYDKNNGNSHEDLSTVVTGKCLHEFFLECETFQTDTVEKIQTHILLSIKPPPPKIMPFVR
jgi:hypothetical protein